jgi:nucleoside-diphosphate-sugar epimerase
LENANLIPQIMREAILEKKVSVLNAAYSRDFLYSKDLARILLEILEKDFDEVELNIATGIQRTVGEIAGFISAKLNIPFEDLKRDLNKSSSMKIDISRFTSLFPDFQFSKFEDALNETLHYYLSEIKDEKIN